MGIGESDGEAKRIISVGFIRPVNIDFRDNTIYICLRPNYGIDIANKVHGGGLIGAVAFSRKDFLYQGHTIPSSDLNSSELSNMAHVPSGEERTLIDGFPRCEPHYEIFIQRLERANDAEIKYRFFEDGLELMVAVQGVESIAKKIFR